MINAGELLTQHRSNQMKIRVLELTREELDREDSAHLSRLRDELIESMALFRQPPDGLPHGKGNGESRTESVALRVDMELEREQAAVAEQLRKIDEELRTLRYLANLYEAAIQTLTEEEQSFVRLYYEDNVNKLRASRERRRTGRADYGKRLNTNIILMTQFRNRSPLCNSHKGETQMDTRIETAETTHGMIFSEEIEKETIKDPMRSFTRNRKLTYTRLVTLILSNFQTTIQTALNRFLPLSTNGIHLSQSAFSQARAKINDVLFRKLFEMTASTGYGNSKAFQKAGGKLFHGRLICAVDATQVRLPHTKELKEHFWTSGQGGKAVTGRCSILYDVQNDIILDARFGAFSQGERAQAVQMLEKKHIFQGVKELLIFDRGYFSLDFLEALLEGEEREFLFRIPTKRLAQADTLPVGVHSLRVELKDGRRVRVRVVKFALPTGEVETLVTNCFLKGLRVDDFQSLYFMRWPAETKFDIVKNKIAMENFSGRTVEAIYQDVFVSLYLANMVAIFKDSADQQIRKKRQGQPNKYEYQANINEIVGSFHDRFILACIEDLADTRKFRCDALLVEIEQSVVPIRPSRSVPRPTAVRHLKFYHNRKANG